MDDMMRHFTDDCEIEHSRIMADFHKIRRGIMVIKTGLSDVANRKAQALSEFEVTENTLKNDLTQYEKLLNETATKLNKIQQKSVSVL